MQKRLTTWATKTCHNNSQLCEDWKKTSRCYPSFSFKVIWSLPGKPMVRNAFRGLKFPRAWRWIFRGRGCEDSLFWVFATYGVEHSMKMVHLLIETSKSEKLSQVSDTSARKARAETRKQRTQFCVSVQTRWNQEQHKCRAVLRMSCVFFVYSI